jgi:ssDNA-binding Zn-finger/Zn-ribbon topoisomerase 1
VAKKKSPAQLDREIAESLALAGATTPHSAKALVTLAQMGTSPSQWQLTPIKWVEEEREVMGLVTCPICHGHKFVRIVDGHVIPPPPYSAGHQVTHAYSQEAHRDASKANKPYGNCPRCGKQKGGWGMIPQGKIKGMVRAKVMVGDPQFPPGTRFDSRFAGGLHCNLCNKLVMKSHRVPVHATGDDSVTHGMFVGEDCAQKFLDVKLKRDEDSIMETGNAPL